MLNRLTKWSGTAMVSREQLLLSALVKCWMPRATGRAAMLGNRTRVIWEAAQRWAAEHVGPAGRAQADHCGGGSVGARGVTPGFAGSYDDSVNSLLSTYVVAPGWEMPRLR